MCDALLAAPGKQMHQQLQFENLPFFELDR
jgi:hypothetical protein